MCTVSYIPKNDGYVMTSNRDEDPDRKTLPPEVWSLGGDINIKAPRDQKKNGTWIATDERGRSACLLNGAFIKHTPGPPYRMSRGALIPMAFQAKNFFEFYRELDLKGVEPFTLILIDDLLQVIKWDGEKKQIQFLSKQQPHLWSSATLYSGEQHLEKLRVFTEFLKGSRSGASEILELHGSDGRKDFVLMRPEVQTVSITQIVVTGEEASMSYLQPVETAIN